MIIIGLTGVSGSGKSHIRHMMERYGFPSVNADAVVHSLYSGKNECTVSLARAYGNAILNSDHSINRRALAAIVFFDKEKLALLNQIVHPFVTKEIEVCIQTSCEKGERAFIIEAPQLFESGLSERCDYVISVIADKATRIKRICERDGIAEKDAMIRIENQYSDDFFKEHSDFCIDNEDDITAEKQIQETLKAIGLLA